jgi:hypothetical protein
MEGLNGNYSGNYLKHFAFFEIGESGVLKFWGRRLTWRYWARFESGIRC